MPCDSQSTVNRSAIMPLVWRMEDVLFFSITVNTGPCVVMMDPQGRWVQNTHHHMAESCMAGLLKSTVDFVGARNKLLLCWGTETVGCFSNSGLSSYVPFKCHLPLRKHKVIVLFFCEWGKTPLMCSPVGVETAPSPWAWVSHLQESQVPKRKYGLSYMHPASVL